MKNEEKAVKLFNGVTGVGDDLIEEAGTIQKRKKMTPWRGAAIAACLCLALVGTAAAVHLYSVRVDLKGNSEFGDSNYTVSGGFAYIPAENFSPEVQAMAVEHVDKSFHTWDELETFVGRNLVDNPLLETAKPGLCINSSILQERATNILLSASADEDGRLASLYSFDNYMLDHVLLERRMVIYTDAAQAGFESARREGYEPEVIFYYDTADQVSEEEYIAVNGLTVSIIQTKKRNHSTYRAHFSINGAQCWISATYQGELNSDNSEQALTVLKQVLDSFQV